MLDMVEKYEVVQPNGSVGMIIAQSQLMSNLMEKAKKAARTDVPILLVGEAGTEKEEIARFIHNLSYRTKAPFKSVDCVIIGDSSSLIHAGNRIIAGVFQEAKGGTVFLDEISRMELSSQHELLMYLETGRGTIGKENKSYIDVRVVAGIAENLETLVQQQKFLRELYYRLKIVSFEIPALRMRLEDIPPLVEYLVEKYSQKYEKYIWSIETDVLDVMLAQKWLGNVKELDATVEGAVILSAGHRLSLRDFGWEKIDSLDECNLEKQFDLVELKCVKRALSIAKGQVARATRLLGLRDNRRKLYNLLKKHHIDISEYKRT